MNRFEDLAKGLAGGMKRREALRRLGGGLAGALLATVGVRRAIASGGAPPNAYCAHDCTTVYPGASASVLGSCISSCEACANSTGETCFTYTTCEGQYLCACYGTTEGTGFCGVDYLCDAVPTCSSSADCPTGWFCSPSTCCQQISGYPPTCSPPCATSIYFGPSVGLGPTSTGR